MDQRGKVRPEVTEAVNRGVLLDVGHAGVHCRIKVVKGALQQGLAPLTISTDLHAPPPGRTFCLMNDLVSKFHALGMTLSQGSGRLHHKPGPGCGLETTLGSLAPGMAGDAAVFDLRQGRFVWHDGPGDSVEGKLRPDTFLTVRAGSVVWREGRIASVGEC